MTNCKESHPEILLNKSGWDRDTPRLVLRLVHPCASSWAEAEALGHTGCPSTCRADTPEGRRVMHLSGGAMGECSSTLCHFRWLLCYFQDKAHLETLGLHASLLTLLCFPRLHRLLSVPGHVANERPIPTSLGHQLGFFCLPRLIMPLSLVQFWQLMHLHVHKWLFVFTLSDMCVAVLPGLGPHLSLSCLPFLIIRAAGQVLVWRDRNQWDKLQS